MSVSCDPATIVKAAKCFSCVPKSARRAVRLYLLCQAASGGTMGNLIPSGSTYSSGGTFTITVLANSLYCIVWGAGDVSVTIGGVTYLSTGVGTGECFETGPNTTITFNGTAGTPVNLKLTRNQSAIPAAPTGFTWVINGANVDATWTAPGATITKTELWTSSNGTTYSLAATVAAPGTSVSVAAPSAGNSLYGKIRFCVSSACGVFNAALVVTALNAQATGWRARVISNGGANPSDATTLALSNFWDAVQAAGISGKMLSVNCFVPDSLIACLTPLFVGTGIDPWGQINGSFAGRLNVNGLKGFGDVGNANALDTGVVPNTSFTDDTTGGITIYTYEGFVNAQSGGTVGCANDNTFAVSAVMGNDIGTTIHWEAWAANGNGDVTLAGQPGTGRLGYLSGNRTAANLTSLYGATSGSPHALLASKATTASTRPNVRMYALGARAAAVVNNASARRLSFVAIHQGLTQTESAAFFAAVQAMRVALGGGFV